VVKYQYMKEKNYQDKISKINLDIFKQIIRNDEFRKIIKEIRIDFDILPNGLKKEKDIRKLWDDITISSDNSKNKKSIHNFDRRIREIIHKFKLTDNFQDFIREYIIRNTINAPDYNAVTTLYENKLAVVFYGKPTKLEWKSLKERIDYFLDMAKKGNTYFLKKTNYPYGKETLKPKPKIDRDLNIISLSKKKGIKIKDNICNKINKYSDESIEAKVWENEDSNIKETERHKNIIRKVRQRKK